MHSSKMCTARFGPFFFVVIGLSCQFKCSFFVPSYLPTTPLPCEQTNTCQNITFSKLRWRAVITACKRSLRRLCFYTCLSVILFIGGGAGLHGGGWADPPPSDTMGYGQRVSGTHPTGMHSCCIIYVLLDALGLMKRACAPLFREPFRICDNFMECCRNNE